MGYRIFLRHALFVIEAANTAPAFTALRACDPELLSDAPALEEAMRRFGWQIEPDTNGSIDGIYPLTADYSDHHKPLIALIPFVKHGSYIEMEGLSGDRWRWVFAHQRILHEQNAVTSWSTHTTWTASRPAVGAARVRGSEKSR
ncbi:MAG: hypothetical protein H6812_04450 [Phycisphaeraceae bacterium]|nr:hypothetical protein [Phycisphaerales bacterium]MCB9842488.1 hypothetical protein [Phycisphaeraceae bacterium]